MDERIERKKWGGRRLLFIAVPTAIGLGGCIYMVQAGQAFGQTEKVSVSSLETTKVKRGRFEETMTVRGTLSAKRTVYLDAVAGGIVEEKLVEAGVPVKKDQPLVRLSNTNLQLEVISREAQISEQLNFLRNNQLLDENSRQQLRSDILEDKNQIEHLQKKIDQARPLVALDLLPRTQLQEQEQDLDYYTKRVQIATEEQAHDELLRAKQNGQLTESTAALEKDLAATRAVLDNLMVRAPVDGQLSELNVELGESKAPGSRLGRIDVLDGYKVVASIDEYYLSQVSVGMTANVVINGKKMVAKISKVDGRVKDGKFLVDVDLPEDIGHGGVALGQSLDVDIVMGAARDDSLLLERGAFFNDTGGNWIFVLSDDGHKAVRRPIKLGSKDKDYYQVLSGLNAGDVVVVSSYSAFDKADTLRLY